MDSVLFAERASVPPDLRFATCSIAGSHRFYRLHDRTDAIYVLGEKGARSAAAGCAEDLSDRRRQVIELERFLQQ